MPALPRLPANGAAIPVIGFGTFRLQGEPCRRAVATALASGYRHIDTAAMYDNEADVGQALAGSGIARSEIFVTTKVWSSDIGAGALQRSAARSLAKLGLAQVDLLLIHWPNPAIPLAQSIGALCDARRRGLAAHIGVSNFPVAMLEAAVTLAASDGETIAALQCEHHPHLDQSKLIAAAARHGIGFISYCPLGRGSLVNDATIAGIARKRDRTPAQIILRWHLQKGVAAIPRSARPEHIAENIAIADFALDAADMAAISALHRPDGRMVSPPSAPKWDD
jgi:diketogulonate reductase-like aldo/keto reductase